MKGQRYRLLCAAGENMKKNRHEAILNLISKEDVGTQEELMIKLNALSLITRYDG